MIEPEDLMISGNSAVENQLRISDFGTPDRAVADLIASRMTELQSMPVQGAFDANHLQQIHARIFQGAFPWSGQLREPQSSVVSSLDMLFDRLARENRLKGLDADAWSKQATEYIREIAGIEPFIEGNDLAALEFFRELAGENNMTLHWKNAWNEPSRDELQQQSAQNNNLRRILMLAVDSCPSNVLSSRDLARRHALELIASRDGLL